MKTIFMILLLMLVFSSSTLAINRIIITNTSTSPQGTETDPIFTANNASIWNSIDLKMNITDQRCNFSNISPGGSNDQIQFNNNSRFAGTTGLTYNTTDSSFRLRATGSTDPSIQFRSQFNTLNSEIFQSYGNGSLYIMNKFAYSIIFSTDNKHRMNLNHNGDLGLGTLAPLARLHIENKTTSAPVNNGNSRILLTIDGANNPLIKLQSGRYGLDYGFASIIDFSTSDNSDYDSRIVKWRNGYLSIYENVGLDIDSGDNGVLIRKKTAIGQNYPAQDGYILDVGGNTIIRGATEVGYGFDYVNAVTFYTTYSPITMYTAWGYYQDSLGGSSEFYVDELGDLISAYDDHIVGTLNYSTGYVTTTAHLSEDIIEIHYEYIIAPPITLSVIGNITGQGQTYLNGTLNVTDNISSSNHLTAKTLTSLELANFRQNVTINGAPSASALSVKSVGNSWTQIGQVSSGFPAICFGNTSCTTSTYVLSGNGASTYLNYASTSLVIRRANADRVIFTTNNMQVLTNATFNNSIQLTPIQLFPCTTDSAGSLARANLSLYYCNSTIWVKVA